MWRKIKLGCCVLSMILMQHALAAGYPDRVASSQSGQAVKHYVYACNWAYNEQLQRALLKLQKYQVTNILEPYSLRLIIPSYVLFKADEATLSNKASTPLLIISNLIQMYPGATISVRAYTDTVMRADDGQHLTDQQAQQVAGFFWQENIPDQTQVLTYKGMDSADPIARNQTINSILDNRRIEVVVALPH